VKRIFVQMVAAPMNPIVDRRSFADASFEDVVRTNVAAPYSSAWLDLSAGPMVPPLPPRRRTRHTR